MHQQLLCWTKIFLLKSNESFKLTWELANFLVKPQLQYQIEHCNGLQVALEQSFRDILEIKAIKLPSVPESRKYCRTCLRESQGKDAKKKKNTLDKPFIAVKSVLSPCVPNISAKFDLMQMNLWTFDFTLTHFCLLTYCIRVYGCNMLTFSMLLPICLHYVFAYQQQSTF